MTEQLPSNLNKHVFFHLMSIHKSEFEIKNGDK